MSIDLTLFSVIVSAAEAFVDFNINDDDFANDDENSGSGEDDNRDDVVQGFGGLSVAL